MNCKTSSGDLALRVRQLEAEVEQLRQEERDSRQRARLAVLGAEVAGILTSHGDIRVVLEACAESIQRSLCVAVVRIWILDPAQADLTLYACAGVPLSASGPHPKIPVGETRIGRIAEEGRPCFTAPLSEDCAGPEWEWAQREHLSVFAGFPLTVAASTLGVIDLLGQQVLDDLTIHAMGPMANQIALTIEHHRAVENRRDRERQYRLLHETMMDAFVEMDMKGRILETNRSYQKMLGYGEDELRGLSYEELTPRRWQVIERDIISEEVLAHGHSEVYEKEHVRKDGSLIPVELRMSLLHDEHGEPSAMWAIVRDITGRKRAEEEVRRLNAGLEWRVRERTAKLAALNEDLESFAYSVSHDLRAPLRSVAGFSSILAVRHRSCLNEEGRHYLDNIVLAGERMGRLIDDLLEYSRIGRRAVRLQPVALQETFEQVTHHFSDQIMKTGADVRALSDLPVVSGDATLLMQILSNLLQNALTYHRPNVPLQITLDCREEPERFLLSVSDNGIGILKEHQGKVFNVFQRLHSDDQYPGTGIGLSIVKKSVELLGGRVWLESAVDVGSTFWIELPREKTATEIRRDEP
ncbi:MAG: PAS domain S-box protein [Lentisphaerae bacterium]|nr:PAS domain S-box protein [Lentisphaerota bacterium]